MNNLEQTRKVTPHPNKRYYTYTIRKTSTSDVAGRRLGLIRIFALHSISQYCIVPEGWNWSYKNKMCPYIVHEILHHIFLTCYVLSVHYKHRQPPTTVVCFSSCFDRPMTNRIIIYLPIPTNLMNFKEKLSYSHFICNDDK